MHSIKRSPEPAFLNDLLAIRDNWNQLEDGERRRVRFALARDFSKICGYCEQSCVEPTRAVKDDEESVDHFRPRHRFPDHWLNWLNLIYACRRCNQAKGPKWPAIGDTENLRLAIIERYEHVSEYICPNQSDVQPFCETLFAFNLATGEIAPADDLDNVNWSKAYRTIVDFDLNSMRPGQQDLPELRRLWIRFLEDTLRQVDDPDSRTAIVVGFTQRNKPFSSFTLAYARGNAFDL